MGLPDPAALREARRVIDMVEAMESSSTDLTVELQGRYDKARSAAARLVNAEEHEIALVESTSHGLGLIAAALPLRPGDNVLVCDLEFFPTVLCWKARQEEMGLEVREVRTHGGSVTPADFEARMDARTRALVISSVQEINGFRADVAALAELAHAHGALLLVDGTQEVGALAVDVRALRRGRLLLRRPQVAPESVRDGVHVRERGTPGVSVPQFLRILQRRRSAWRLGRVPCLSPTFPLRSSRHQARRSALRDGGLRQLRGGGRPARPLGGCPSRRDRDASSGVCWLWERTSCGARRSWAWRSAVPRSRTGGRGSLPLVFRGGWSRNWP